MDLNDATPEDEYPMVVVDMLINSAAGNEILRVSQMGIKDIIRSSLPKKMCLKLVSDVQGPLARINGS
jgi:hypothetical protein